MRIQSHTGKEYKGKEYKKFWVVIPRVFIEALHWKAGDDVDAIIKDANLILKKKRR